MPEFTVGKRAVSLRPSDIIGSGGEADIYKKGSDAYKIFKTHTHPDLAGNPVLQQVAKDRIEEHQKKLPAFPKNLPAHVSIPQELVLDKHGRIAGYRMQFIEPAEVLLRYGERGFRDQGIADDSVVAALADLHRTVDAVHRAGVVIGDFNDLNVLVRNRECYVIDADSMQFGAFMTRVFTAKFVDPLVCDPKQAAPVMVKPHSAETDWYSYLIMLMQSLLFVGPYGGVYRPADKKKFLPHDARPLRRITVFDSEVRYPKPARPFKILPDALLDLFEQAFKKDARAVPPLSLIEGLRFTRCTVCGQTHARNACPDCVGTSPAVVKEVVTGTVSATKVFSTPGTILFAVLQQGKLRYLYHDGVYRREDGNVALSHNLDHNLRFRIYGARTVMGRGGSCSIFEHGTSQSIATDALGLLPLIDATEDHLFYVQSGALQRIGSLGILYPERIGDVLQNQTLFWVGDDLGFGFYRAAELSNFFVFHTAYRGLNDSVNLPLIRGQLVDATCCFSKERIWFFTSTQEAGKTVNRCFLLDDKGILLGTAQATAGDGSWLGTLRGKSAAGTFLLAPTDDGVMRIVLDNGSLEVAKIYADTTRFVDAGSQLFLGNEGLYVVDRHDVWRLTIR